MYALYPNPGAPRQAECSRRRHILSVLSTTCTLRSRVGMVFQRPTPFPMSICDNIAYGIGARTSRKVELDDRVEWAPERPPSGTTSRTSCASPARASRAASSSAFASPAALPSSPRSFCSTSRARPLTRSRPPASRSSLRSSRTTTRSSSSLTPCSRPPASPTTRPSSTSAN